jgi:hypothetical protein
LTLCNQLTQCILCAGFAHLDKSIKNAYLETENLQTILQGALINPQEPLQCIQHNTTWQDFYIIAMQYFVNEKLIRKKFSHLGARGLPLKEVQAVAASHGLQHSEICVEICRLQTGKDQQIMVRVTKDMGNWLYGQWHIATFPDAHQRLTLNLNTEHIGDVTEAVLGIAWLLQFAKIPELRKWMLLSQQMQASLETYAATATRENNDAEIAAFHGSKKSASWPSQVFSMLPLFNRQEQAGPSAEQTPAIRKEEVPTPVAVALADAEAKACTLSSPRCVPAGTLVISEKLVPKFKKRLARLDRHMMNAQNDLTIIRKGLHIESDGSEASSSEDNAKENPLSLYIKRIYYSMAAHGASSRQVLQQVRRRGEHQLLRHSIHGVRRQQIARAASQVERDHHQGSDHPSVCDSEARRPNARVFLAAPKPHLERGVSIGAGGGHDQHFPNGLAGSTSQRQQRDTHLPDGSG